MILTCLGKKRRVDQGVDSEQKKRLMPLLGSSCECRSKGFVCALFHNVEVELESVRNRTNQGDNLLTLTGLTNNGRETNAGFGQCNQRAVEKYFATIHGCTRSVSSNKQCLGNSVTHSHEVYTFAVG